jgi:hypothetical protein
MVPPVGCSMPDSTAISDDLPEPEGQQSHGLARRDLEVDAAQDVDPRGPGPSDRVTLRASMT